MSVKVTSFADPAAWEYQHADAPGGSHGGTLDPATVTYGTGIDGQTDLNVVVVPCPFENCGSVSYWPPGGGADALMGQSLHVMVAMQPGLGRDRWVLDDQVLKALEAAQT
jgi:hypothetical protein